MLGYTPRGGHTPIGVHIGGAPYRKWWGLPHGVTHMGGPYMDICGRTRTRVCWAHLLDTQGRRNSQHPPSYSSVITPNNPSFILLFPSPHGRGL